MHRAKFAYELFVAGSSLVGSIGVSSAFAYDNRSNGPASMFGAAVFGGAVGAIGGAIAGASAPIAVPGMLIGAAYGLSESGSKKLIDRSNSFLAGEHGPAAQATPSGTTAAQTTP